jgi:two-component system phosphate regulon response regulator OmpR
MSDLLNILVVDDDPDVCALLEDYLGEHGYRVRLAHDASSARALIAQQTPDAALLDIGLPGEDGLALARHLRERYDIGIMMISGAGETVDRIVGLEIGADDYIAKPFDLRELRARLKSVLRRYVRGGTTAAAPNGASADAGEPATRRVPFGICQLDLDTCLLLGGDGEEVPITRAEFELLRVFAERPNRPLSRDQLFALAQNRDWDPLDRSIDIRVARLRKKVEADADHPRVIRTVRGVGYMYVPGREG